jgi:hypothetical protein
VCRNLLAGMIDSILAALIRYVDCQYVVCAITDDRGCQLYRTVEVVSLPRRARADNSGSGLLAAHTTDSVKILG